MSLVQQALQHVNKHHPEVTLVFYGTDMRWFYCDEAFEAPDFGDEIDIGLLEDAVDSVEAFPAAFALEVSEKPSCSTCECDQAACEDVGICQITRKKL